MKQKFFLISLDNDVFFFYCYPVTLFWEWSPNGGFMKHDEGGNK
jgi:hypothetical protein